MADLIIIICLNYLKGLEKFKWGLLFNTVIHLPMLIFCILGLAGQLLIAEEVVVSRLVECCFGIVFCGYCTMLQRYNHIRINKVIKLIKKREARRQERNLQLESKYDLSANIDLNATYQEENPFEVTPSQVKIADECQKIINLLRARRVELLSHAGEQMDMKGALIISTLDEMNVLELVSEEEYDGIILPVQTKEEKGPIK